jgi:D-xylose transport system substrate-binding protein
MPIIEPDPATGQKEDQMRGVNRMVAVAAAAMVLLTGCATKEPTDTGTAKKVKIGVILPDNKSSMRWETADRKYLELAFQGNGVDYDIQNAQGDTIAFQNIADQMIANGVTILMIISQDANTGKAVLDRAKSQGVATIDYDRLTPGGSALYHVSFDNTKVGTLLGEGLVRCLRDIGTGKSTIAELNGAPTDDNSTLFKNGYDAVLKSKYDSGEYIKGPDEWVQGWENARAATMFEQMISDNPSIAGVVAANDGLANAAIIALRKRGLNGRVPVTGQDATVQGLQNILLGDQCMTVYKDIKREADAAAQLAISLAKGETRPITQTRRDPVTGRAVPSVLLDPVAIFQADVKKVVADGFVTKSELCALEFVEKCAKAGIS